MACQFNGAKDAGEQRFDPRYDCTKGAVWHLLLAQDARDLTTGGQESVLTCEKHAVNVHYSTAMRHRAEQGICDNSAARWRLTGNCCAIVAGRRRST